MIIVFSKLSRDDFSLLEARMGGGLLRLAETNDARTHQRPSEECIVEKKEKKKEGRKDRFAIYYEKMKGEARRKDGKRSPVKRPGAPVSVDTALIEYNARPGRLSLTITVCYLVQLKHPLSLSLLSSHSLCLCCVAFLSNVTHTAGLERFIDIVRERV